MASANFRANKSVIRSKQKQTKLSLLLNIANLVLTVGVLLKLYGVI